MIRRFFLHAVALFLATAITQIGGLAYLGALALRRRDPTLGRRRFVHGTALFSILYAFGWTATLYTAPQLGRFALPCRPTDGTEIVVLSPLYCALNRHYVTPELLQIANDLAKFMNAEFPGTQVVALDASFPFLNGFPLLPHLSHGDGRKLDIAFFYQSAGGRNPIEETRSPIGYWAFEHPRSGAA